MASFIEKAKEVVGIAPDHQHEAGTTGTTGTTGVNSTYTENQPQQGSTFNEGIFQQSGNSTAPRSAHHGEGLHQSHHTGTTGAGLTEGLNSQSHHTGTSGTGLTEGLSRQSHHTGTTGTGLTEGLGRQSHHTGTTGSTGHTGFNEGLGHQTHGTTHLSEGLSQQPQHPRTGGNHHETGLNSGLNTHSTHSTHNNGLDSGLSSGLSHNTHSTHDSGLNSGLNSGLGHNTHNTHNTGLNSGVGHNTHSTGLNSGLNDTHTTKTGPVHRHEILNKADPRVHEHHTQHSQNTHSHVSDPLDATKAPPSVMKKHLGEPIIEHDQPEASHQNKSSRDSISHQEAHFLR